MPKNNEVNAQAPNPADFDAIREAVMETPRGRWFLAEYENRLRSGETAGLLHNLKRLESALAANHDALMSRLAGALAADPAASRGSATQPQAELAPKHMKFFQKDEDIFEPAPQAKIAAVPDASNADLPKGAKLIIHRSGSSAAPLETTPETHQQPAPEIEAPASVSAPAEAIAETPAEPKAEPVAAEAEPKRRIVIIRHKAGDEIDVPLQKEMAEAS